MQFGEAVRVVKGETAGSLDGRFEGALLAAMDELKVVAMGRDARSFATLKAGAVGTGGFYGVGQRIVAFVRRREYRPEHTTAENGGQG